MSKPDPTGGSLESILASIRQSLSEQSTDALSDASAAVVDPNKQARPSRRHGLTQRLAGTTAPGGGKASDDLSDLLEDGTGPSTDAPSAVEAPRVPDGNGSTAVPDATTGEKDPLWFLTRRDDPVQEGALPPVDAAPLPQAPNAADRAVPAPSAAEPTLTRPEVLRASMPPFFGSSAEVAAPSADGPHVPPPQGAAPVAGDAAIAREVSLLAAAAETAAARPPQVSRQPPLNGKGPVVAVPSPDTAMTGDTPLTRALEVMVLDLLKPMLRQWLDENMPRLVAEALSEEVQRTRAAKGDAKKT